MEFSFFLFFILTPSVSSSPNRVGVYVCRERNKGGCKSCRGEATLLINPFCLFYVPSNDQLSKLTLAIFFFFFFCCTRYFVLVWDLVCLYCMNKWWFLDGLLIHWWICTGFFFFLFLLLFIDNSNLIIFLTQWK